MVGRGKGRVFNNPAKVKGKVYDRCYIHVPTGVAQDETFPFQYGDQVVVRIEGARLLIERADEEGQDT